LCTTDLDVEPDFLELQHHVARAGRHLDRLDEPVIAGPEAFSRCDPGATSGTVIGVVPL
jgi:hypothetical protein